uniref:Leucine-rich repeat-containing protein 58 n=1 Tax=Culex pipiens TaxID=7175 RepID=A0A8D8F242_CULPI
MISLLIVTCLGALAAATSEFSCSQPTDPNVHCVENRVLNASHPTEWFNPTPKPALHLTNCTVVDDLSSELLGNATELWILDGSAPKVHLKPSLKSFTSLRAGTGEVVIEPTDNFQLELFDLEGSLQGVPRNVQFLKRLAVLDLCQNRIENVDLDQFNGMSHLRKINLGWNRIRTVTATNVNLPSLAELFLHGNQLTSLDLTHLNAPNLQRLYVASNQLKRIDGFPAGFPQLARVDLHFNRWRCDWLRRTEELLAVNSVETLGYLPEKICDEHGTIKVSALQCEQ